MFDYFLTINQCMIAIASSWLGVAEIPGPDVHRQIESWQRSGGIYSRPDEADLKWDSLFVNAVASDCMADRLFDGWTGNGVIANKSIDWSTALNSPFLSLSQASPGDVVVWRPSPNSSPSGYRVGIYAAPWGTGAMVITGDYADQVIPLTLSASTIVAVRRLDFYVSPLSE